MKTDLRDMVRQIDLKDPMTVGGLVSLAVAIVLFSLTAMWLALSVHQRLELEASRDAIQSAVARAEQARRERPEELRRELADAQRRLGEALADFPSTAQADAELSYYYRHADELGARLVRIQQEAIEQAAADQSIYSQRRFLLEVEGEVPDLMRFLSRVGAGPYVTFSIDNLDIRSYGPSLASADLTVLASDLGPGTTPRPVRRLSGPAPSSTSVAPAESDLLRLESQMIMAMAAQDWPKAVEYGRRILAQSPDHPAIVQALYQSHLIWAQELADEGRSAEATEQFQEALRVVPGGEEALEGLRQLAAGESGR